MTDEEAIKLARKRFGNLTPEFSSNAFYQIIEWAASELAADQIMRHTPKLLPSGVNKKDLTAAISVEIGNVEFENGIPPIRCFLSFDCGDSWAGMEKSISIEDSGKRYLMFPRHAKSSVEQTKEWINEQRND